jgi:ethanolaminephosphotransferase
MRCYCEYGHADCRPLGLLFDHGCDALNCSMLGSLVVAMSVGADAATWRPYAVWAFSVIPFFMNTWEE